MTTLITVDVAFAVALILGVCQCLLTLARPFAPHWVVKSLYGLQLALGLAIFVPLLWIPGGDYTGTVIVLVVLAACMTSTDYYLRHPRRARRWRRPAGKPTR